MRYRSTAIIDFNGDYNCENCAIGYHAVRWGVRYPLLCTSSILANWRRGIDVEEEYEGDPLHLDSISIPGARIANLRRAFVAEYGRASQPVDLLLCAGLNDVSSGASIRSIARELELFRQVVQQIPGSTFAACRLPYPPSMARIGRERPGPYHINRLPTLSQVNDYIYEMNNRPDQSMATHLAPSFQTWGCRARRANPEQPRRIREGMVGHREHDWREQHPGDQLHLADSVRLRMGRSVIRYFQAIYGILPDRGPRPDQQRRANR
jgi:hypothetical protein